LDECPIELVVVYSLEVDLQVTVLLAVKNSALEIRMESIAQIEIVGV